MDNSEVVANVGKELPPQQPKLNVGLVMREARERLGMSVNDVAERIKFAPRQVEALESNDFAHLPQTTFLRGFVRSYARMLQLDEEALLASLPAAEQHNKQVVAKASRVDVPFPAAQLLRRINVQWLAGALGVALLLGLFVWLHEDAPMTKPDALVVEPVALPAAEPAAVSAVPAAPAVEPAKTPEPAKVVETKKAVVEAKKPTEHKKPIEQSKPIEPAQPVVAPKPEAESAVEPMETEKPAVALEVLKRRPLHFVFEHDAWAEVKDVNGAVLLSRMNRQGSEKWIGGPRRAPYDVSISRPGNVKLYYKGREIDLSAYASMEVAHLKVE